MSVILDFERYLKWMTAQLHTTSKNMSNEKTHKDEKLECQY